LHTAKHILISCHAAAMASEAVDTAKEVLAAAQQAGDKSKEGAALLALAQVLDAVDDDDATAKMLSYAQDATEVFKGLKDGPGEARALVFKAIAEFKLGEYSKSSSAAKDAMSLAKAAGSSDVVGDALNYVVQSQIAQDASSLGISDAQEELQKFESAGDQKGIASVLKVLVKAYTARESHMEGLLASKRALELYRQMGDKKGEADLMILTAELQVSKGSNKEAMKMAKDAMAIYQSLDDESGKVKANDVLSDTYAAMGQPEKAPNRSKAFNLVKQLMRTVQQKDVEEYKKYDRKLMKYYGLMTPEEFWGAMRPAFDRDQAGAMEFLTEQGYDFNAKATKESEGPCKLRHYDHTLFYTYTRAFGGMGFGPQFRSVHSFRYGTPGEDAVALAAVHLPETEDWELKMSWRPGYLDAGLQALTVNGFPPFDQP